MALSINSIIGYGQVEPNHLSAQRTGQIYAQLPANSSINTLENGEFVKYDYAQGEVNRSANAKGEWMLVYDEVKLYDERKQMTRDFALKKEDAVDGVIVPRVFKTNVGDIYTTNKVTMPANYTKGDYLEISSDGLLVAGNVANAGPVFQVVAETNLPDMQPAIKVMRVK